MAEMGQNTKVFNNHCDFDLRLEIRNLVLNFSLELEGGRGGPRWEIRPYIIS